MDHELREHELLEYITAGKATITIKSDTTGARYTYKISAPPEDERPKIWFVKVLTGPDNECDYQYIGSFRSDYKFYTTYASKMRMDSKPCIAFRFMLEHENNLPSKLHIYRPNKCGRCGRTLTTPESIISGFGPECRKAV